MPLRRKQIPGLKWKFAPKYFGGKNTFYLPTRKIARPPQKTTFPSKKPVKLPPALQRLHDMNRAKRIALAQKQQQNYILTNLRLRQQQMDRAERIKRAQFQQRLFKFNRLPRHVRQYMAMNAKAKRGYYNSITPREQRYLDQEYKWRRQAFNDWYWQNQQ